MKEIPRSEMSKKLRRNLIAGIAATLAAGCADGSVTGFDHNGFARMNLETGEAEAGNLEDLKPEEKIAVQALSRKLCPIGYSGKIIHLDDGVDLAGGFRTKHTVIRCDISSEVLSQLVRENANKTGPTRTIVLDEEIMSAGGSFPGTLQTTLPFAVLATGEILRRPNRSETNVDNTNQQAQGQGQHQDQGQSNENRGGDQKVIFRPPNDYHHW